MQTDWSTGRSDDQGPDGGSSETPADGGWVTGHEAGIAGSEVDPAPGVAPVIEEVVAVSDPVESAHENAGEAAGEEDAHRSAVDAVDGLLDEVERALARLDDGTYGRCETCGSPIDDTDLAVQPLVRQCGCAEGVLVIEGA
jgi:RNA polymerase-binding transcription factor DksA